MGKKCNIKNKHRFKRRCKNKQRYSYCLLGCQFRQLTHSVTREPISIPVKISFLCFLRPTVVQGSQSRLSMAEIYHPVPKAGNLV